MDAQFKRGLLETCVLSVLSRGDSYGYQIIKDLSSCVEISESTLYPILKRLESSGCLSSYSVEHKGRLRKFYRISAHGQERIEAFLENWKEIMTVYEFIREGAAR
ncbi:MAG: PadR family transcriptional regulator [Firmicutes bacterium]|nr:PadR family transcriptional regulator [Bacillota bacterium]